MSGGQVCVLVALVGVVVLKCGVMGVAFWVSGAQRLKPLSRSKAFDRFSPDLVLKRSKAFDRSVKGL